MRARQHSDMGLISKMQVVQSSSDEAPEPSTYSQQFARSSSSCVPKFKTLAYCDTHMHLCAESHTPTSKIKVSKRTPT